MVLNPVIQSYVLGATSELESFTLFARLKPFFANTDGLFSFHIDPIGEMSVFRKKSIVFSNGTRVRTCTHCDNSTFSPY